MAIKELTKPVKKESPKTEDKRLNEFIAKGGTISSENEEKMTEDDHRLTLRIPKHLMEKVDKKRKKRVGKISRNLWILEVIERATQKV